jgi:hypothetical protein
VASFVATETIVVRGEHGEPEPLVAGQTWIHDSRHFLVRQYPDLFEPVVKRKRERPRSQLTWKL